MVSPCSSVNCRTVLAGNSIGDLCKSKKPLSAAKACIPQILPSKFKPRPLPPGGGRQEGAARRPKAHSCEDLYASPRDDGAEDASDGPRSPCGGEDSGGARDEPPAIRRSISEFSSLYRTMHHIQRPSSAGCSPHGSVRSLASMFERPEGGRSEADGGGRVPRDSVSSRVSEFETMIQRCVPPPNRCASLPALHGPDPGPALPQVASAVSAESLLVGDRARGELQRHNSTEEVPVPNGETMEEAGAESAGSSEAEVEQIFSSQNLPKTPVQLHHQQHLLHHLNHQHLLKPSTCKGSCPASYTRFTTILRHERQQEKPPAAERKTAPPGNLFLMGPAPFRLRKTLHQSRRTPLATRVTGGPRRPCSLSPELRPLVPQRHSSLEVLEKLSHDGGDRRGNEQGSLDANGNPLADPRRGCYLHPFPSVTLSPLWSLICLHLCLHKANMAASFLVCVLCFSSNCAVDPPFISPPNDGSPPTNKQTNKNKVSL